MKHSSAPAHSAFSLPELLIALSISAVVGAVCVGVYVNLQRGYTFVMTWSDLDNNLCRVEDSIAVDLRNATSITITDTPPVQTLTLTVPQCYSPGPSGTLYSPGDSRLNYGDAGYDPGKVRAGDPAPDAILNSGTLDSTSAKLVRNGTLQVTYSGRALGTSGQAIQRMAIWSGSTAALSGTAVRDVAKFDGGVNLTFQLSGTTVSGTTLLSSDTVLGVLLSGTSSDKYRPKTSTLQDTVYLRGNKFK